MTSIKNTIYDTLEKDNKPYMPHAHNPSSASFKYSNGRVIGKDMASLYAKWMGFKPSNPATPGAILRMKLGDGTHTVVAQILAKAGIKAMSEVSGKVSLPQLEYPISYRVDGLNELNGDLEVLEVKSSTDQAMFGKGWGIEDKGAKEDHLLQVICYLNLVPGVKRARLLYISRDSGKMLEYVIERDETPFGLNFDGIVARWNELEVALENHKQPDPEYKAWINDITGKVMDVKQIKGIKYKTDWQVLYDPYMSMIWEDPKNYNIATYNAEFKAKGLI